MVGGFMVPSRVRGRRQKKSEPLGSSSLSRFAVSGERATSTRARSTFRKLTSGRVPHPPPPAGAGVPPAQWYPPLSRQAPTTRHLVVGGGATSTVGEMGPRGKEGRPHLRSLCPGGGVARQVLGAPGQAAYRTVHKVLLHSIYCAPARGALLRVCRRRCKRGACVCCASCGLCCRGGRVEKANRLFGHFRTLPLLTGLEPAYRTHAPCRIYSAGLHVTMQEPGAELFPWLRRAVCCLGAAVGCCNCWNTPQAQSAKWKVVVSRFCCIPVYRCQHWQLLIAHIPHRHTASLTTHPQSASNHHPSIAEPSEKFAAIPLIS